MLKCDGGVAVSTVSAGRGIVGASLAPPAPLVRPMTSYDTVILVIDDDRALNELLTSYLQQFGMHVLTATTPDAGLKLLRDTPPSLVILDLMLPGRDGFAVCREIRRDSTVPIIMLTARGDLADRVAGLELGADDYLAKPFEPRELVARIQTVLRRSGDSRSAVSREVLQAEGLTVDLRSRTAQLDGVSVDLTTMEFELLAIFFKNPGTVLSRDQIMEQVRGVDWDAYNRSIDVAMSRLRHKLHDDPKRPRYFRTVWGTGYLFIPIPQVTTPDAPDGTAESSHG
ncbi:DNA-binding response regulator [Nitrospira sp.]|nr:DNA-binding response regulator [Nitrospira sp.]